jgi:exopolyphosphatase/guanosine-5'-triphosphate,3'-diphosphate pyrophosphatase
MIGLVPSTATKPKDTLPAMKTCVGLVELGSSSLRCCIAESDGKTFRVVEELERQSLAGEDVFRGGKVSAASMEQAVEICRKFGQILSSYRVSRTRAIATSILGGSTNGDILLERLRTRAGLDFELLDEQEEARILLVALRPSLRQRAKAGSTLAVDLSGSSAEFLGLEKGLLTQAASFNLGTLRLRVLLEDLPSKRRFDTLGEHLSTSLGQALDHFPTRHFSRALLAGRDALQVARFHGHQPDRWGLCKLTREELMDYAVRHLRSDSSEGADGLVGYGALLFAHLLERMRLPFGWVPEASLRDGLLEELCDTSDRWRDTQLSRSVLHCVRRIGKRYAVDAGHAGHVARLSLELFDRCQDLHGMGSQDRLLLQVAAELHEIGHFANPRSHHKHSAYLIEASDIPGISRPDLKVVAQVARYHRRSAPRTSHLPFQALPAGDRVRVRKLAGLLRIADALDAGHEQAIEIESVDRRDDTLFLTCSGKASLNLESLALASKSNLFQETHGLSVRIVPHS